LSIRMPISRTADTEVPTGARRLASKRSHPRVLVMGSDPRRDLPFVSREAERVADQLGSVAALSKVEVRAGQVTKADVLRSLQQGADLLPYWRHIDRRAGGAAGLLLADGWVLTTDEIANSSPTPSLGFLN